MVFYTLFVNLGPGLITGLWTSRVMQRRWRSTTRTSTMHRWQSNVSMTAYQIFQNDARSKFKTQDAMFAEHKGQISAAMNLTHKFEMKVADSLEKFS